MYQLKVLIAKSIAAVGALLFLFTVSFIATQLANLIDSF